MTEENEEIKYYEVGGMWEYSKWEIYIDCEVSKDSEIKPCKHCHSERIKRHERTDGTYWEEDVFTCPYVVVGINEGGYNSTGICLECIMEVAKELLKEE